jgi:hypothetical protein
MNRWLKRASIGLCVALLPVWTQLLPADATSTDQLFFNVNAGDPGSYTSGSPTWTDLAGDRDGTIFDTDGKRITYDSTNKALVFPGDASSYVDMGSGFSNFGSGLTIEFEGHFGAVNQGWERIFDFGNNNESDKCYSQLVKTRESLSYIFTNDLSRLKVEFDNNFNVVDGQHPHLLKLYLRHEISIETMIILDDLIGYMKKWNRRIEDDILWPTVYLKCKKFRPFFQYDRDKMKQIVLDKFS